MFTRDLVRDLRKTMLTEMQEVARKYGVEADFGTINYTTDSFRVKMTVNRKNAVADSIPPMKSTGPLQVGSLINHPARKDPMKVVEITNRGSVLVVTPRGTRYRLKMTEALKYAA